MHAEELWTGRSLTASLLRGVLTPVSWLYAAGWQGYLSVYGLGLKKARAPHSPIVCVGNLQVGGTGKTPAAIYVSDVLTGLGREVAISCSGYGSPASEAATVAPGGLLKASEWGDEAALIRWLRPAVPLIVGRRRVLAAELCHERFPRCVMLMDDGFQHLPLKQDLSILLDPPVPNRRCLPAGPYREPWGNRRRADLVIPSDRLRVDAKPPTFLDAKGEARPLAGEVSVLCALGRPQAFLQALAGIGLTQKSVLLMPDHDPLTAGNLLSRLPEGLPIVVTGKDWVKLRERPDVDKYDIAIVSHSVAIEPEDAFREWLQDRLNGISH